MVSYFRRQFLTRGSSIYLAQHQTLRIITNQSNRIEKGLVAWYGRGCTAYFLRLIAMVEDLYLEFFMVLQNTVLEVHLVMKNYPDE